MANYRFLLLGKPWLEGPAGPVRVLVLKARALLCYLAAHPQQMVSRLDLTRLLWEQTPAPIGRQNLAALLAQLRRSLPVWPLREHGDALGWDPVTDVTVDTNHFLELTGASLAPGAESNVAIDDLRSAVALWRGPFLDGIAFSSGEAFAEWLWAEQQLWERRFVRVLNHVVLVERASGNWDAVVTHGRQALAADPLNEAMHRALMEAYAQLGQRASRAEMEAMLLATAATGRAVDVSRPPESWLSQVGSVAARGRADRALPTLTRLLPMARASGDGALLASVLAWLGLVTAVRGEYPKALTLLDESIPLFRKADQEAGTSFALGLRASVQMELGSFSQAEAALAELSLTADGSGDSAMPGSRLGLEAKMASARGQWSAAAAASREGMLRSRAAGRRDHEYFCSIWLGLALARMGEVDAGMAALENSIRLSRRAHSYLYLVRVYAWLAETRLLAGRLEAAEVAVRTGLRIGVANGHRHGIALCTRIRGLIAAAKGNLNVAKAHALTALERFTALGARPEIARCLALLAELAETEAKRNEYRAQAAVLYDSLGLADTPLLAGSARLGGAGGREEH